MRTILVKIGLYGGVGVLFSLLFIGAFHTALFESQDVLFYRGVTLLSTVFGLFCLGALFIFRTAPEFLESFIAATIASASIHLAIFVVFPVTFDRSVTMHLLHTLRNAPTTVTCHGLSPTELEKLFIESYIRTEGAIPRRIHEQSVINMIAAENSCVSLSERGSRFLNFSTIVSRLYNLSTR